jgi:hypothetical protein
LDQTVTSDKQWARKRKKIIAFFWIWKEIVSVTMSFWTFVAAPIQFIILFFSFFHLGSDAKKNGALEILSDTDSTVSTVSYFSETSSLLQSNVTTISPHGTPPTPSLSFTSVESEEQVTDVNTSLDFDSESSY